MAIDIAMPRLSDTMEVGTVVKWNVKPGDKVKSGDVIADIETDKATMELQTFDDGVVAKLPVAEGQSVKVGTVILVLAAPGETVDSAPAQATAVVTRASSTPAPVGAAAASRSTITNGPATKAPAPPTGSERVFASPLARKIAAESNVDLGAVRGTGPSGRIVSRDVETAIVDGPVAMPSASRSPAAPAARHPSIPAPQATLTAAIRPLTGMRVTIARRLVQSKTTIPHYQVTMSARMDALLSLRTQLNDQLAAQGVKLSVNDFLVRACALAMHQHPEINSRWIDAQGDNPPSIELLPDVNIGVAIALPPEKGGGLVVATLRGADQMGLRQIGAQTRALSEKARTRGLTVEEMADSTFTISNLGMFGVDHFTAIINPPNTAILAVGAAVEQAVVSTDPGSGEKRLVPGHLMSMTMSSDHRVIDGAMAAGYLATVKQFLEAPATLLV